MIPVLVVLVVGLAVSGVVLTQNGRALRVKVDRLQSQLEQSRRFGLGAAEVAARLAPTEEQRLAVRQFLEALGFQSTVGTEAAQVVARLADENASLDAKNAFDRRRIQALESQVEWRTSNIRENAERSAEVGAVAGDWA